MYKYEKNELIGLIKAYFDKINFISTFSELYSHKFVFINTGIFLTFFSKFNKIYTYHVTNNLTIIFYKTIYFVYL